MFKGKGMRLEFGTQVIFDDAEFQVGTAEHVGVVGVNGAGKSTLFRVIMGEQPLDGGSVSFGRARIACLPQVIDIKDRGKSVWQYLSEARPIRKLEEELERIYGELASAGEDEQRALLSRMARVQAELESYDPYNAEDRLLELAISMDFTDELLQRDVGTLSGGQKSKVAFARVLYAEPDVLLLDEPTNHLDATTRDFVVQYLKGYMGTILMISHDVDLLDKVAEKIMFLDRSTHKITMYQGNYTAFKRQYAREKLMKELRISQQEREIKRLSDFVLKAKQASRTNHNLKRMGQDREAKLEKAKAALEQRDAPAPHIRMRFEPRRESSKIPLEVKELSFHYPSKEPLYRDLSFALRADERFLIVGENGVGKSTLLKLIMGLLVPDAGEIRFGVKTDTAYYAQEFEALQMQKTVLENVLDGDLGELTVRNALGNFLFSGDAVQKQVIKLSPGERARVALCKLLLSRANLLILDEPTNHLDPETRAIVGRNFRDYTGTILLVSHDPAFAEEIGITRMLILPEGKIVDYSKELLAYYYILNEDLF